ncbi:HET-domain-containing protein [Lophium mytilinum]|uniref:HET-domain-containing protein n=1 Tax=Lophium mytilinum TaxID=390894 RepID=A0A6A6QC50_9PEZI|nr:HET-domain-containing protein [Lophium mytilinum]
MRLLNTRTLQLEEFGGDKSPQYAILSHTWGADEVTFQDLQSHGITRGEERYSKIEGCCKVAAADGFDLVWIDTCCIDKTSSSELSEAINSMYHWYQEAEVCYAYLADVLCPDDLAFPIEGFSNSRWFTRGWTLQELIAPSTVVFFSSDWQEIGTKGNLPDLISKITGIHPTILMGESPETVSVAQRMSWASKRKTTRIEDLAYCLMGLFGINMPMLYGEGEQSFIRLEEEIMKITDDHSIFAWRTSYMAPHDGGILATSPKFFADSGNLISLSQKKSPPLYHFATSPSVYAALRVQI